MWLTKQIKIFFEVFFLVLSEHTYTHLYSSHRINNSKQQHLFIHVPSLYLSLCLTKPIFSLSHETDAKSTYCLPSTDCSQVAAYILNVLVSSREYFLEGLSAITVFFCFIRLRNKFILLMILQDRFYLFFLLFVTVVVVVVDRVLLSSAFMLFNNNSRCISLADSAFLSDFKVF